MADVTTLGYVPGPGGFYSKVDGSGPYSLDRNGVATLLGAAAVASSIPSGENHIGEVGGSLGLSQVQFGPAANTTFTAGQAISAPIEMQNMARVDNGTGLLVGATMELAVLNTVQVDLIVFSRLPVGSYTAATAFSLAATDRGFVSKALKFTDWTALGASESLGEVLPGPKFFSCRDTSLKRSLWVVPVARGSIALPAGLASATLTMRASRN